MVRKILQIGDPILEQPTQPVDIENLFDKKINSIVNDLLDTCSEMRDRSAGLSANQIGEKYSICVCRRTDLEEKNEGKELSDNKLWEVMINPKLIRGSEEESAYWEGCLSIGEKESDTVFGPVWRPNSIKVKYLSREGETVELSAENFFAHVIQHELDHLNGILFISKVPNPTVNLWKSPEFEKYLSENKDYPPIN